MRKLNYRLIITTSLASVFLIFFGLNYIGVFSSNKILVKIHEDATAPHFNVIIGQNKIKNQLPDTLKRIELDFNYAWISNKEYFFKFTPIDFESESYYYLIEAKVVGKKKESLDTKFHNPELNITSVKVISGLCFWSYILLTFVLLLFSLYQIFKKKTKK